MKNYEYIKIYQLNEYFDHVAEMLVEHFNKKEYDKTLFVLGMQVIMPISQIKDQNAGYKVIVYQSEQLMSGDNWHNVQMMIKHLIIVKNLLKYVLFKAAQRQSKQAFTDVKHRIT